MAKVAAILRDHASGLFNYLFFPITNAVAEGLNAMIQHLRVAARGLPRFETFRARILFHLGKLSLHTARSESHTNSRRATKVDGRG